MGHLEGSHAVKVDQASASTSQEDQLSPAPQVPQPASALSEEALSTESPSKSLKRPPSDKFDESDAPSPKKFKPTEVAVKPLPEPAVLTFVPAKRVSLGGPRKEPTAKSLGGP